MAKKLTKVFLQEFKGNPTFSIWAVDESGNKVGEYPVVSFGKSKASALMDHLGEFKKFLGVAEESGERDLLEGL